MRYIILLFIIIFSNSCKECSCLMVRFDIPLSVKVYNPTTNDTFIFYSLGVIGSDFNKNPFAPTPQKLIDTLNKLTSLGYYSLDYIPTETRAVDCSDCQNVLKYNSANYCKQYSCN